MLDQLVTGVRARSGTPERVDRAAGAAAAGLDWLYDATNTTTPTTKADIVQSPGFGQPRTGGWSVHPFPPRLVHGRKQDAVFPSELHYWSSEVGELLIARFSHQHLLRLWRPRKS